MNNMLTNMEVLRRIDSVGLIDEASTTLQHEMNWVCYRKLIREEVLHDLHIGAKQLNNISIQGLLDSFDSSIWIIGQKETFDPGGNVAHSFWGIRPIHVL